MEITFDGPADWVNVGIIVGLTAAEGRLLAIIDGIAEGAFDGSRDDVG